MAGLNPRTYPSLIAGLLLCTAVSDPVREAAPPGSPRPAHPAGTVLFADDFNAGDLKGWAMDRIGVWSVRRGSLRADLPDRKQQRSFLYAGSQEWTDYAVDLDVCMMRGVDKGVVVRVEGDAGIGVDLRGPGYQDVLLQRREWPLDKARVVNANGVWHHLRVEARGHRYRVWVNGALLLDRDDSRQARPRGRIALAAYTGGVGECTVYYDNVLVTALASLGAIGETR
ncbi:MAG TPA: DUF1080 domain-containing protein [Candidatus Eisenbacteria bacterium]|jgi:hypothetical protein